jgi:hypothetical protein
LLQHDDNDTSLSLQPPREVQVSRKSALHGQIAFAAKA